MSSGPGEGTPAKAAPAHDDIYGGGPDEGGNDTPPEKPVKKPAKAAPKVTPPAAEDDEVPEQDEEDDEGGEKGEGAGDEDFSDLAEFEEKKKDDLEELEEGEEGEPKKAPAQPTVLKLDKESIEAIRGTAKPEAGEKQMSPEEVRALLNPVIVTPEVLQSMGFSEVTPEQVKGFQNFANAIVKNSFSMTKVLLARKEQEFSGMLEPLMQERQQNRVSQTRQAFFTKYPSLSKYEKIVRSAAQEVQATNADGSERSQEDIFREVARSTVATLRSLNIQITKQPQATPGAGGRKVPNPNKFSSPGRSGGDGAGVGKPNNPDADIYSR